LPCQGAAARQWLAEREAELLPVPYFHAVFTLPARIADIAYQNTAVIYDLLFKASSEAVITIAADPKHMGAIIGITAVLHTWGSTMTHHPHVHMIVPGGGISLDGQRWIASRRPRFILPVRVLSELFRGLMLQKLLAAHAAGKLQFFGQHAHLAKPRAFAAFLGPLWRKNWFVYTKDPFGGPKAVLAYLSRYTHRVAISNSRLITADETGVTFKYKDYRIEGPGRYKVMTLATHEFIRRFLVHVLPTGFHRIRHYGLFANSSRAKTIARARELLASAAPTTEHPPRSQSDKCPCCGRPHANHRDFCARLTATLPSINTERPIPGRYLMTTITALRPPSTDCFCCRSLIGRDTAQQFAACLPQIQRLAHRSRRRLDYWAKPQCTLTPVTDPSAARCACPTRLFAPNKSP
jgi:hypothetical protein